MKFRPPVLAGGVVALGGLLAVAPIVAQETRQAVQKVADTVAWRPTAIPDRINLTLTATPATSQAVGWRTDKTVAAGKAFAQIVPAASYPKFTEKATQITAETTPLVTNLGPAHYHNATFDGLKPGTLYAYRVGDGANWSEWNQFRTASEKPEPFSFIYFGDAQNDVKSLWSRAVRTAYSDAPKARFMIHAGDLINVGDNDADWGEWHYAGGWVNGVVPSVATPGNHEYGSLDRNRPKRQITPHWRAQFALPQNGPAGVEESCYYLDYQNVRVISLNTEELVPEQAAWLDRVLAENKSKWTVLTFHRPIFSTAKGRDNKAIRETWMPLFDKHRVDLVLQGHDHTYGRSRNIRAGVNVRDDESGTVYVVSVSGPKMYELEKSDWIRRGAEDTQLYQIVHLDGDTLRYEARTVTGELYDAFELQKQRSKVNRFVDRAPKTPERLRTSKNTETN